MLAYSGGLDTSIIIPWLKENYGGCEVIAMIGDLGQQEDLEGARKKGARHRRELTRTIEDLREEFVTQYIWPTLRAGAVYEHKYLAGHIVCAPDPRQTPGGTRARKSAAMLWRTAAPAKATTRCALSWRRKRSRPN